MNQTWSWMRRTRCLKSREYTPKEKHEYGNMWLTKNYRAGGIIIVGTSGKVTINNTLEERLNLLGVDALPQLRLTLFGENQNRKFTD